MEPKVNRFLFSLVGISLLLAGCAEPGDGNGPGPTPTEMTNDQARALLASASSDVPEKVGFDMRILDTADKEIMSVKGAVDNSTGTGYFEMKGDADALGGENGGPGDAQASEFFSKGFALYTTADGSLYLAEDVAYVFPPSEGGEDGFVPSPEESGFGALMNPQDILANLSDEGVNVTNVRALTHHGKAAIEVTITATDEDGIVNGTVILYQNPARVAHVEATGLANGDDEEEDSPFTDARLIADFTYDDEVTFEAPEKATRALGLAYTSDANPFGGFSGGEEDAGPTTWTFQHDGGIALTEVELHAKEQPTGQDFDLAGTESLWSMKLSDGTATHGSVTVTYTDADTDGKVSEGDTLQIVNGGDEPTPMLVLKDTVTGVYVVPGPGLVALLAGLGALAVILRRR